MEETFSQSISTPLLALCARYRLVPLEQTNNYLIVASANGLSVQEESALQFASGKKIRLQLWPEVKVLQALQALSKGSKPPESQNHSVQSSLPQEQEPILSHDAEDEPVVTFINNTLETALKYRASDIHFEPYGKRYRIRFRIDGVLQEIVTVPAISASRLAARLKILAQLNIAERRLPQDGQITLNRGGDACAMRISTLPVVDGEKVVLRVMESGLQPLDIRQLGMNRQLQQCFLDALHSPQGLVLVTGPTGSGKTVTLYSGLNELNHSSHNICSIEDPVEVVIEGVNQTQANDKVGFTFSQALRAFLRQDPDIIMVGEIRDRQTAEIAIEAAQTGHLVLSTLHTNSTVETLTRLGQMGIPAYLLVAGLRLIIAQRLVRCLCPFCKIAQEDALLIRLDYWQGEIKSCVPSGCERCNNGYFGRTAIYEMLHITPTLKRAIFENPSTSELEMLAIGEGMEPLFLAGLRLVSDGVTSLSELFRTLGNQSVQNSDKHDKGETE